MIKEVSKNFLLNSINNKTKFIVYSNYDDIFSNFYKKKFNKSINNNFILYKIGPNEFEELFDYHKHIYPALVCFNGFEKSNILFGFKQILNYINELNNNY